MLADSTTSARCEYTFPSTVDKVAVFYFFIVKNHNSCQWASQCPHRPSTALISDGSVNSSSEAHKQFGTLNLFEVYVERYRKWTHKVSTIYSK